MALIEVSLLSKHFGDLSVLDEITFSVDRAEVVAIIGPSGSGKSTLLRCIKGLDLPSAGRISVGPVELDVSWNKVEIKRAERDLRKQSGMVFQSFNLYPHKTALENVIESLLVVRRMARSTAVELGEGLLEKVGLLEKSNEYPSRLSGGQQQRVAIARSLAMEPSIMLFDEPTSALDPELVAEVLGVIRQLAREGTTMLIVTHEMEFAREVSTRVLFMDRGRILEDDGPQSFFTRPSSERAQKFLAQISRAPQ